MKSVRRCLSPPPHQIFENLSVKKVRKTRTGVNFLTSISFYRCKQIFFLETWRFHFYVYYQWILSLGVKVQQIITIEVNLFIPPTPHDPPFLPLNYSVQRRVAYRVELLHCPPLQVWTRERTRSSPRSCSTQAQSLLGGRPCAGSPPDIYWLGEISEQLRYSLHNPNMNGKLSL